MNLSKIYVGNLSYDTTEDELRDFFGQYGTIEEMRLITDYQTGRSKGFGFITFSSEDEGKSALDAHDHELGGRKLNVKTATDKPAGGRGGRGGNGGGRGGNGGGRW